MKTYFIAAFAMAALLLSSCGGDKKTGEKETAVYQCPMKCEGEKTYSEPGACPKCGMDLQKTEGHQSEEHKH